MDKSFWYQKWEKNEIGFHGGVPNPLLVGHFERLSLPKGARVFLPLCGKSLDIHWLLAQGYRVAGAELSRLAVDQLFRELGVAPEISGAGELVHYRAQNIDLFVGDIFTLSRETLGPVDAVYDRAALVALPGEMRSRYTGHLMGITGKAPQLLICYAYDQALAAGPPFSVSDEEVLRHYQDVYEPLLVTSLEVPGGLRGQFPARENVWLLKKP
ncbi:MAG TPA: thiopurine S-methyltransferase [bacterium]|nr:thiopurine S-methyltransferase [bacterium]